MNGGDTAYISQEISISFPAKEPAVFVTMSEWNQLTKRIQDARPTTNWFDAATGAFFGIAGSGTFAALSAPADSKCALWVAAVASFFVAVVLGFGGRAQQNSKKETANYVIDDMKRYELRSTPQPSDQQNSSAHLRANSAEPLAKRRDAET